MWLRTLTLLTFLVLGACASNEEEAVTAVQAEQDLLELAQEKMDSSSYQLAIEYLQLLEARYPFGPYAEQAQLSLIYAYYKGVEYEAAIETADRFIRLHPQHPNIDYAYYLRGLANFDKNKGPFAGLLPQDPSSRDTDAIQASFGDFATLLGYFPDSEYAADAKSRLVYLRNVLARQEIIVANYYLKRGAYLAALNRGQNVVENFPQTPAVADGLAIMVQSYLLLDKNDLADNTYALLVENYPNHPNIIPDSGDGYFDQYFSLDGVEPSTLAKFTGGLFGRAKAKEINNREFDLK